MSTTIGNFSYHGRPVTMENIQLMWADPVVFHRIPRRKDYPELLTRIDISNKPAETFAETKGYKGLQLGGTVGVVLSTVYWKLRVRQLPISQRVHFPMSRPLFKTCRIFYPLGGLLGVLDGCWEAETYRDHPKKIDALVERAKFYRQKEFTTPIYTNALLGGGAGCIAAVFWNEGFVLWRAFGGFSVGGAAALIVSSLHIDYVMAEVNVARAGKVIN